MRVCTPVSTLAAMTMACGTTPLCGSVTIPVIDARWDCARAAVAARAQQPANANTRKWNMPGTPPVAEYITGFGRLRRRERGVPIAPRAGMAAHRNVDLAVVA